MSRLTYRRQMSQKRNGARLTWQMVEEPRFTQMWNPWSKDIPWLTFVSHPLHSSKGNIRHLTHYERDISLFSTLVACPERMFDVQDFITSLRNALEITSCCIVEYKPIVIESYIGLPALVHNYTELGFYKVRGKLSF